MTTPHYQVFAIKYAQVGRKAWGNFVDGDPHEDWDMPLDYFVWAIVGDGRTFVVDTGFDMPMASSPSSTGCTICRSRFFAIGESNPVSTTRVRPSPTIAQTK